MANPSFGGSEIGDHVGARGKTSQLSVIWYSSSKILNEWVSQETLTAMVMIQWPPVTV
jgi:hypothetical protein